MFILIAAAFSNQESTTIMNNIIVTTPEELERIITKSVAEAMAGKVPQSEPDFISIDQAAELVNLSKHTIYSMVNKREIPYYKRGKRLYFKKPELQNWIGSQKVRSREELQREIEETGSINFGGKKGGRKC